MEFFDFPHSIREFSSIQSVSVYTNVHFWSEIALMWFHWLPLQNERKMQTEMNAKCKRKWWFRWLLLRLSNKGRTNVSSAWMAVLKHPAIGAKSRFTKIYENLRKSCDVTKMRFGRKIFVSQKDLSDTHMTSSLFSRYSFSSWRYSWCGVFRILDFGNLISFERNELYQILPEIQCGSTTNASVNPTFSSENTR